MAKKKDNLIISICRKLVEMEKCERGYYLGEITVDNGCPRGNTLSMHVEAVEVRVMRGKITAINRAFQSRIDGYVSDNDGLQPTLLDTEEGKYFIRMDPFAR